MFPKLPVLYIRKQISVNFVSQGKGGRVIMDKVQKPDRPESLSTVQEVHAYLDSLAENKKIPFYVKMELTKMVDRLARIDPLTGCLNREGFRAEIRKAVDTSHYNRRKPHGEWLCLWLMDIHKFKNINDSMGHLVGDKVLEYVGQALIKRVRHVQGVDFASHLGGDEFGALLTDVTDVEAVIRYARSFQKQIAEYEGWANIHEILRHMPPMIDIGCAFLHTENLHMITSPQEIDSVSDNWYDVGDKLSYQSKESGSIVVSRTFEYDRASRKLIEAEGRHFRQHMTHERRR
jgi:diguanylate cyclase (GGDEF)-like protein